MMKVVGKWLGVNISLDVEVVRIFGCLHILQLDGVVVFEVDELD